MNFFKKWLELKIKNSLISALSIFLELKTVSNIIKTNLILQQIKECYSGQDHQQFFW